MFLKKKPKIVVVDEYLYSYLQRETSAMNSVDIKKIESRVEATKLIYDRLHEYVDESVMGALMFAVYSFCVSRLLYSYNSKKVKEFVKNSKFMSEKMNTKFNYKAQSKNVGFARRIWYLFIHKQCFGPLRFVIKFIMKIRSKNK